MSIRASSWAWGIHGLTLAEKLVLLALADFSDDKGECWPKQGTMTEMTGMNKRTARRAIRVLQDKRLLKSESRYRKGRRTSNYYWLSLEGVTPPMKGGMTPGRSGSDTPNIEGVTPSIYKEEPSVEPSVEPSGENGEESEKGFEKEDKGIENSNFEDDESWEEMDRGTFIDTYIESDPGYQDIKACLDAHMAKQGEPNHGMTEADIKEHSDFWNGEMGFHADYTHEDVWKQTKINLDEEYSYYPRESGLEKAAEEAWKNQQDEKEYPDDLQLIANPLPTKSGPAKKKKKKTLTSEDWAEIHAIVDAEDDSDD